MVNSEVDSDEEGKTMSKRQGSGGGGAREEYAQARGAKGSRRNSELSVLKHQREGYRLNVRNTVRQIDNVHANLQAAPVDPSLLDQYAVRLQRYEQLIEDLDTRILYVIPEEEMSDESASAAEFRELIWNAHHALRGIMLEMGNMVAPAPPSHPTGETHALQQLQATQANLQQQNHTQALPPQPPVQPPVLNVVGHMPSQAPSVAPSHVVNSGYAVRLPKLMLPKFDGDPLKWQEFWDFFDATVHTNAMPAVEKMKYLKQCLVGDASALAQNYRLTNDTYQPLIDKLKQRFGRTDLVISAHIKQLWAVPAATAETKSLQRVFDECDRHIATLSALGLTESEFGKMVAPIITEKLPWSVRHQLNRANNSNTRTMDTLREALTREIEARQMADGPGGDKACGSTSSKHQNSGRSGGNQHQYSSASALTNQTSHFEKSSGNKPHPQCVFCKEGHWSDQCPKVATLPARMEFVRQRGHCFKCLASSHIARDCHRAKPCFRCKRQGHCSALCRSGVPGSGLMYESVAKSCHNNERGEEREGEGNSSSLVSNTAALSSGKGTVYMQMASVKLTVTGGHEISARLLFDSGSTCSFITAKLQKRLRLPVEGHFSLSNAKFEETERRIKSYPLVSLSLPASEGSERIPLSLFVTDQISCSVQKQPLDPAWFSGFKDIKLADTITPTTQFEEIDILIGSDHYFDIVRDNVMRLRNGLVLVESKLGYIPSGRAQSEKCTKHSPCLFVSCFLNEGLRQESVLHIGKMERFWRLEDIGIKDDAIRGDDDLAVEKFEKSVKEVDGRVTVGWPWKSSHPELPVNRDLAFGRLQHLLRRIQPKKELITAYDEVINDQLKRGMIEEVPDESKCSGPVHYLPHHEVVRTDHSTTKLRIVYDGSAKRSKSEPSLNDCLLRGPVLLGDLCGLLLRFRTHAIAFTADIEKAHLQVGLQESERDVTRFLWIRDISRPADIGNVVVYRFTRVLFGIIASAFLLDAAIRHKMRMVSTKVSLAIAENTYVDNLTNGTHTESQAVEFFNEAVQLFEAISMNELRAIKFGYSGGEESKTV